MLYKTDGGIKPPYQFFLYRFFPRIRIMTAAATTIAINAAAPITIHITIFALFAWV